MNYEIDRQREEREKQAIESRNGICSTCDNFMTCNYSSKSENPVWECDEYIVSFQLKPEKIVFQQNHRETACDDSARYRGLCANCQNRENCGQAQSNGGIWHCENYQ
jgi:hypothetical protein